ncbi:MAG: MBL fold metallo-hydrolase [Phycisphaerae bacterium]
MAFEMCILGSGSSGNATLLRSAGTTHQKAGNAILIDAGFGPQTTAKKLAALGGGIQLSEIRAICLTHLDRDHINMNWLATLVKYQISVFCHESAADALRRAMRDFAAGRKAMVGAAALVEGYETGVAFAPVLDEEIRIQTLRFAHDEAGSHGFLIEVEKKSAAGTIVGRIGYATDLGHVPAELPELFCGVDVLALESNYDPDMELASDRPWPLKQRVMGGSGHLSNQQAYAAVQAVLDTTEVRHGPHRLPKHIVLLHRSRECNCPQLLRRLFEQDDRIAPRLTLAEQYAPTGWLRVHRAAGDDGRVEAGTPRITVQAGRGERGTRRGARIGAQLPLLELG